MQQLMLKRQEFLCARIEECLYTIRNSPPGKLEIYKNHYHTKWFIKPKDGQRIYLPKKERKKAGLMAEKRIAEIRLAILEKELRATKFYLNHYPKENELNNLLKAEALFAPLIKEKEQGSWEDCDFETNLSFPEALRHSSPSGHMLRSKSECMIDIALFHRNIPFRYESRITILGNSFYPDFTILNRNSGKLKYWEHFGMMDDPKYRKKALEKIVTYISNGLIPGKDIYFTYETQSEPLTMSAIDRVIDEIEAWLQQDCPYM